MSRSTWKCRFPVIHRHQSLRLIWFIRGCWTFGSHSSCHDGEIWWTTWWVDAPSKADRQKYHSGTCLYKWLKWPYHKVPIHLQLTDRPVASVPSTSQVLRETYVRLLPCYWLCFALPVFFLRQWFLFVMVKLVAVAFVYLLLIDHCSLSVAIVGLFVCC